MAKEMGLDRAPIEFQTFYFSHVLVVPPNIPYCNVNFGVFCDACEGDFGANDGFALQQTRTRASTSAAISSVAKEPLHYRSFEMSIVLFCSAVLHGSLPYFHFTTEFGGGGN